MRLIPEGHSKERACSLDVYTEKFTRARGGSLPTPKQIMQVLVEQEETRGSCSMISPVYFPCQFKVYNEAAVF